MKNVFILLMGLSLLVSPAFINVEEGGDKGIQWMDFNTGFAKARAEGKIAIIDCYTDWCGWCKVMDKKTFSDPEIIERMNTHFIPIKFNPEIKDAEYYMGQDTVNGGQLLYGLTNGKPSGYPTLFYYIPGTNQMYQKPGYQDVETFNKSLDELMGYYTKTGSN